MTRDAYRVRTLREDDWELLREVRLQALAESPGSFETRHADAVTWPEERWRSRARGSELSHDVMAFAGTRAVGMAGAYIEDDGDAEVISVWVHPEHRGHGVGRMLVLGAMEWARSTGVSSFRLWVTDGNDAAMALYAALGFVLTGKRQPLPTQPWLVEVQMRLREPIPAP